MSGRRGSAVELCAGLGGIGIGLRSLGFDVVKAYDSWREAVAIYNHNAPGSVASCCNLLSPAGRKMLAADRRLIGDVELLAAGPQCKGFSQLRNGYHDGRNGHNRVLAAMPEYVALIRPRMFLIENVRDLIRHRGGKTLSALVSRLLNPSRGLRYRVEYHVYDAAAFGTPQARRRILLLGVREGAGHESLPPAGPDLGLLFGAVRHGRQVPSHLANYLEALRDSNDASLTTAAQALSDLPRLGPGVERNDQPYASTPSSAFQRWARKDAPKMLTDTRTPAVSEDTVRRLRHIPPGGSVGSIPRQFLNGLSRRYSSAYRRLHPDAPSTALSTKYDCVYHYAELRSLSVREYARLQGIPDSVAFPSEVASRRSCYEMIGNSVPPLLVERVLGEALERRRRNGAT